MRENKYQAIRDAAAAADDDDYDTLSDVSLERRSGAGSRALGDGHKDDGGQDLTLVTAPPAAAGDDVESGAGSTADDRRRERRRNAAKKNKVVSWMDLPKKKQLIVITMTRLSEPLVQTSLQVSHVPIPPDRPRTGRPLHRARALTMEFINSRTCSTS